MNVKQIFPSVLALILFGFLFLLPGFGQEFNGRDYVIISPGHTARYRVTDEFQNFRGTITNRFIDPGQELFKMDIELSDTFGGSFSGQMFGNITQFSNTRAYWFNGGSNIGNQMNFFWHPTLPVTFTNNTSYQLARSGSTFASYQITQIGSWAGAGLSYEQAVVVDVEFTWPGRDSENGAGYYVYARNEGLVYFSFTRNAPGHAFHNTRVELSKITD